MIDIAKQREDCVKRQQQWRFYFGQDFKPPQTGGDPCTYLFANEAAKRWPELIASHLDALAEIEQLRNENDALGSDLNRALREGPR